MNKNPAVSLSFAPHKAAFSLDMVSECYRFDKKLSLLRAIILASGDNPVVLVT